MLPNTPSGKPGTIEQRNLAETIAKVNGGADEGYRGTFVEFANVKYGERIDISEKIKPKQWHIIPKIWQVDQTFGWANWSQILSKDYEIKVVYRENAFMLSHLHILLKRY